MKSNPNLVLKALRGANTCNENSSKSIGNAVNDLICELIKRNDLEPEQIVSITFSATRDLDACFPASIARKHPGLENVALLDCQQMFVKNDLANCIRVLALAWVPSTQAPQHPYLGRATRLRPDR